MCAVALSFFFLFSFWHLRPLPSDFGAGAAVVAPERREDAAECRVAVERNRRASAAGPRRPETTWVGESQTSRSARLLGVPVNALILLSSRGEEIERGHVSKNDSAPRDGRAGRFR